MVQIQDIRQFTNHQKVKRFTVSMTDHRILHDSIPTKFVANLPSFGEQKFTLINVCCGSAQNKPAQPNLGQRPQRQARQPHLLVNRGLPAPTTHPPSHRREQPDAPDRDTWSHGSCYKDPHRFPLFLLRSLAGIHATEPVDNQLLPHAAKPPNPIPHLPLPPPPP